MSRSLMICVLAASLCPAMAYAYSNPADFDRPVTVGGGGGRHFTGSPGDGYRCAVCHTGDQEAEVTIEGLPELYTPGATYDLVLRWDGPRTGIALELANRDGGAAGTLELIEPAVDGGLCADSVIAGRAQTIGSRSLIHSDACGATALGVRWTAPDAAEAYLYYGVVEGDVSGSPLGDLTYSDVVPLQADGAPTPRVDVGATCAAAGTRDSSWPLASFMTVLMTVGLWRRR